MALRDDQFWARFLGVDPSDWTHIARKLGYEQYARHVAVRLRNDQPTVEDQ